MIELGHQRRVALLLRLLLGHVGEGQHGAGHAALVVDERGAAEAAYQRRPLVLERDSQLLPVNRFAAEQAGDRRILAVYQRTVRPGDPLLGGEAIQHRQVVRGEPRMRRAESLQ
jgi:hypothetical protein